MTRPAPRVTLWSMCALAPLALACWLHPAAATDLPDAEADAALPAADAPAAPDATRETWVGVISVLGSRRIPLLGKVSFQTDTYVLAEATRRGPDRWDVVQQTCAVHFPRTMGASIRMADHAFGAIPRSTLSWVRGEDGTWRAGPWASGWDAQDHDRDGNPGITLHVAAPFCGGELYASSEASQTATATAGEAYRLAGPIEVHVIQRTLGVKGRCLGLMARDSDDVYRGRIVMQRAPDGVTCDTATDWPVVDWEGKR